MSETKQVRILRRVGNPRGGAILAPGAVAELPSVWADRYIANGAAELLVNEQPAEAKPPKAAKKGKK